MTLLSRVVCLLSIGFLGASAFPHQRRADGIEVKVSTPAASVASVGDLKISASVTNTGSETLKLLKYGTVLDDKLPTRSFNVLKDGKTVPFTGIKLSVSLEDVDDTAFTVLAPGETVQTTHDLSALYDFSSTGTGTYTFEPLTDFVVSQAQEKSAEKGFSKVAFNSGGAVSVTITDDVATRQLKSLSSHTESTGSSLEKRARNVCTNASRKSFIDASYSEAKTLATGGSSYVSSRGTSDALYRAYWGTNTASRVTSVLNAVANENSSSRTLSCTDDYGACSGGVIAYTVIATTNIYYCSIFFNEVATANLCSGTSVASRNVRGGTTLHELTHAVGGTNDVTYGCAADQALSNSQKIVNADNYNCFTTQVYANTRC